MLAVAVTRVDITDAIFADKRRNNVRQCICQALLLGDNSEETCGEMTEIRVRLGFCGRVNAATLCASFSSRRRSTRKTLQTITLAGMS